MNTDNPKLALDEKWYQKLIKIKRPSFLISLGGNDLYRARQKEDFLLGKIRNPIFDYPNIKIDELKELMTKLKALRAQIMDEEKNKIIRQLYSDKIDGAIVELLLLAETKKWSAGSEPSEHIKNFEKLNRLLYGEPKVALYDYALSQYHNYLKAVIQDVGLPEITRKLAHELITQLPPAEDKYYFDLPEDRLVERAARKFDDVIEYLAIPDHEDLFLAADIKLFFEKALMYYGLNNWVVKIDKNALSINIEHKTREIIVPATRQVTGGKLIGLIIHEISTHIVRRENGYNSQLKILGMGLANYQSGEEGVATFCEQTVTGRKFVSIGSIIAYLSICFVKGLDGQKKDFRSLFDRLYKMTLLKQLTREERRQGITEKDMIELEKSARDMAWNRCLRTFRGTDCRTAGVCLTRDLIYLEGQVCVIDVLKKDFKQFDNFFKGKYNPCDETHQRVIEDFS